MTKRTKGPCRTCLFSELMAEGVLICTEGPPTAAALRVVDGKIVGNDGLNFFFPQMALNHPGCWRYEKTTKKKTLPEPAAKV